MITRQSLPHVIICLLPIIAAFSLGCPDDGDKYTSRDRTSYWETKADDARLELERLQARAKRRTPQTCTVVRINTVMNCAYEGKVTIVEFPDGSRRQRHGEWGEIGEEITAIESYTDPEDEWESPYPDIADPVEPVEPR